MPALNYKKHLARKVEREEKLQTIRAYRKDGRDPKPGDILYHYTGMRTKSCRKLLESVCKSTYDIIINKHSIYIDSSKTSACEMISISKADGFETYEDFYNFFKETHGLPFCGLLIKWDKELKE